MELNCVTEETRVHQQADIWVIKIDLFIDVSPLTTFCTWINFFSATHFDFSRLSQKNGLCLLVTLLNKLGASFAYPYYLYHEKIRLVAYPYSSVVTISFYLSENVGYQMNEPLANLC